MYKTVRLADKKSLHVLASWARSDLERWEKARTMISTGMDEKVIALLRSCACDPVRDVELPLFRVFAFDPRERRLRERRRLGVLVARARR